MREILFRGKLTSTGEWSEGNLVINRKGVCIITPDETPIGTYGQVDPETVGQFTGLYDKNGNNIFEGDIITCWDEKHIVEWVDESCGFEPLSDSRENCGHCGGGLSPYCCEVVGNIHDNPELVEEKG